MRSIVKFVLILAVAATPRVAAAHAPHDIEAYIVRHSQQGVFSIYDAREKKALALKYDKVHQGGHATESGEQFYCADLTGLDGRSYDLDFYIESKDGKNSVVEIIVHKVDGKDRIRPAEGAKGIDEAEAAKVRAAIEKSWDGTREMWDARTRRKRTFTFDNVHATVKELPDGSFFACVDAHDQAGVLYDLDTYVRPKDGSFEVLETLIHKRDGKERLR